jgi:signal transduction histidine kinase
MSLRARLVLVLGSLVALLLAAEWSLVRALTRDLDQEVDVVALTVGSSVLSLFAPADGDPGAPELAGTWSSEWSDLDPPVQGFARGSHSARGADGSEERRIVIHGQAPALGTVHEVERTTFERAFQTRRELHAEGASATPDSFLFDGDLEVLVLRSEAPDQGDQAQIAHEQTDVERSGRAQQQRHPESGAERSGVVTRRHREARVALRIGSHTTAVPVHIEGLPWTAGEHPSGTWTQRFEYVHVPPPHLWGGPASPSPGAAEVTVRADIDTSPRPGVARTTEHPAVPASASALRIPVPRGGLDRAVETFLSKLLLGSIALFALGLGAIAWVAHRVTRPLRNLADAAERVGRGQLGTVVDEAGDRDVTKTLRAFNDMSLRLAALDEEAQRLRDREHLGELGDVARGLAHALRNPLHTLGLAVDALGTGRDDARETVRAARTQIQRIDGALEGFLTLAGAGGIREEVALDDLARDVALELAQSTQPCAVRVLVEGGPVPIACVPAELRAVVHALVVNAAEAAPGEPVVVRVEKTQDLLAQPLTGQRGEGGDRARLEVLDRGPGLAPDVRARLFTPHVTTKAHGTGMGLYLAERIARTRYGGSLELHDRPGGGVRAVLELLLVGGERA